MRFDIYLLCRESDNKKILLRTKYNYEKKAQI
jgi:hypothetical protein